APLENPLNEIGLPPVAAPAANDTPAQIAGGPLSSLSSIPSLNSDPGAVATFYLDFHGEPAQAWGGQSVPATPAYTSDGDATTFSTQELANIQEIWSRVSEAFSPFNVNVTTIDPGNWNLAGTGSPNHQLRAVIGGGGSWTGQLQGGIAYVGSYYTSWVPNTVYVFPANLANGNTQYTADDTAHEAGHGFGLQHQSSYNGTTKTAEYNTGNGTTAPFMGNPLAPGIRATWWNGQSSAGSAVIQDDLQTMAGSLDGFGYRTLTYGQTFASPTLLTTAPGGTFSNAGIIETTAQNDYFKFVTTTSGSDTFAVNVAQFGPMLHSRLEIHDAADNIVSSAATSSLSQTITATLAPGTYYLVVKSYGQYGDIGQYTLSGTIAGLAITTPTLSISGATTIAAGSTYTLGLSANDPSHTITGWTIDWGDGSAPQALIGSPASVDHVFAAAGNYTISATLADDATPTGYPSNALPLTVTSSSASAVTPPDPTDPSSQVSVQVSPTPTVLGNLPIKGKRKLAGKFAAKGAQNVYQFTLTQQQVVTLNLNASRPGLSMQLLDADGNQITTKTGKRAVAQSLTLQAGTYEIQFTFTGIQPAAFHLVTSTKPVITRKARAA
ncbi:MAG TPA: PKD domain-containing protein, partial [Tepidisphaeraceae bacterium]